MKLIIEIWASSIQKLAVIQEHYGNGMSADGALEVAIQREYDRIILEKTNRSNDGSSNVS